MKVWINRLPRDFSGGLIVVAANDAVEADLVYYEWLKRYNCEEIWSLDYSRELTFEEFQKSEERKDSRYVYQTDTWEELVGVSFNGDSPQILAEENYIE